MAALRQILLALVIMAAAAAAWVTYFPGAQQKLAEWGLDWAVPAFAKVDEAPQPEGERRAGGRRGGDGPQQAPVITAPVTIATINDRLSAIGTGRALASVTVTPYDSGRLTDFAVASGEEVQAGAVIARLDSESEQIALDRAGITLEDAKAKVARTSALRSSNAATQVQLTEAEVALRNAELALRDAELNLARRSIVAPISGVVGILPVAAGNYVTAQTAVATIDDRSAVIVDFWVPERYATLVTVGAPLSATPIARPKDTFEGTVSAVDNRLDEKSRTLLVQARIENPDDQLRAGMSFQVTMRFPGDRYPSVSPLAIQWGTDGAFVWLIREGKANRTPVRIVQRNTESVLVEAPIGDGDIVVTEGVHAVREGSEVLIAREGPARRTAAGG